MVVPFISSSPAHLAVHEVMVGLHDFLVRVHDERSPRGDGLVDGLSPEEQDLRVRLRGAQPERAVPASSGAQLERSPWSDQTDSA